MLFSALWVWLTLPSWQPLSNHNSSPDLQTRKWPSMVLNTGWISKVRCMPTYEGSQKEPRHRSISQQQGRFLDDESHDRLFMKTGKFGPSTLEGKPGLPGLVSLAVDLSKSSSVLTFQAWVGRRGGKGSNAHWKRERQSNAMLAPWDVRNYKEQTQEKQGCKKFLFFSEHSRSVGMPDATAACWCSS